MFKGFKKGFENFDINVFKENAVYKVMVEDIKAGIIFPALRSNEIHFYYKGGSIFKYTGKSFSFEPDYKKYMTEKHKTIKLTDIINKTDELKEFYNDLKKAVYEKHSNKNTQDAKERQYISPLLELTYNNNKNNDIIALDIEMRLNEENGKKCDLILYNNKLQKLMLIETKLSDNKELKALDIPDVIDQLKEYRGWIKNYSEKIMKQYSNHIKFMNSVFGSNYNDDVKDICSEIKLVIFKNSSIEFPKKHLDKLQKLLNNNVLYTDNLNIEYIWNELHKT